jgi:hypothetical protein
MIGGLAPWPLPDRAPTGSALAYAPATTAKIEATRTATGPAAAAAAPTRSATPAPVQVQPDTTVAVKRSGNRPTLVASAPAQGSAHIKPGDSFNNPWMRAVMLAPSVQRSMSTGLFGAPDFRDLSSFMQKPQASVMMTFSVDPHLGMTAERFAGYAVFFVSTVTFHQRTAALQ